MSGPGPFSLWPLRPLKCYSHRMWRVSFLKKNKNVLKFRPFVVGSLMGSRPLAAQLNLAKKAALDILEVRLDTFPLAERYGKNLLHQIRKRSKTPLLLTFRSHKEGGKKPLAESERLELLKSLLPYAHLVDVEIRSSLLSRQLTPLAHRLKLDVLHSYHDFQRPGRWPQIQKYSRVSKRWKGDVFKVAVTIQKESQLVQFLDAGMALSNEKKILIGMGPKGGMSRLIGFSFGSVFTYGHLGHQAAPGQISALDLAKKIRRIYPKF